MIALVPILTIGIVSLILSTNALLDATLAEINDDAHLHARELTIMFDSFISTLFSLSDTPPIQGIIRARDNGGIDIQGDSTYEQWTQRLSTIFEGVAEANPSFMQLRYLDEEGNELVRIDSDGNSARVISNESLQFKGDRYYFRDTMKLKRGDVFVSSLDLNKEGSPPRIEVPHKPVIRYATPIFDVDGKRRGIVILNIYAGPFLNTLALESDRYGEGTSLLLVDNEGYFLHHPDEENLWGSPRDLDSGINLHKFFSPDVVADILSRRSAVLDIDETQEIVAYVPVFPNKADTTDYFVFIKKTSKKAALTTVQKLQEIIVGLSLLFIFSIILIALFLSHSITGPIKSLYLTTRRIERGDYKARAEIRTRDELGQLGVAFNKTIEKLDSLKKEQNELENAKTRFISITSHELRSPMTPLKAQLQMLGEEYFGKLNTKQKESITTVLRNANRLDKIIVDFLEVSRIEAARLKFVFKKLSLTNSINELIKFMGGFMPEKKIKIMSDVRNLPIIEVDPDRVNQVLRNLINNAIKFSPEGGTVKVTAKKKLDHILFSVEDQGIGVKQEDTGRIFEPFYQAEQTMYRQKGGTGLGLAICRGIIEAQEGRIWLESKEGKGTIFYFTVPLTPIRKVRAIKLLFSSAQSTEKKVEDIFVEILGPMGKKEFEILKQTGLTAQTILRYIQEMETLGIINHKKAKQMSDMVGKQFRVSEKQKEVDLPRELQKLYVEALGPMGKKRLVKLKDTRSKTVVGDINFLEQHKILSAKEASSFRDRTIALFMRKELSDNNKGENKKSDFAANQKEK